LQHISLVFLCFVSFYRILFSHVYYTFCSCFNSSVTRCLILQITVHIQLKMTFHCKWNITYTHMCWHGSACVQYSKMLADKEIYVITAVKSCLLYFFTTHFLVTYPSRLPRNGIITWKLEWLRTVSCLHTRKLLVGVTVHAFLWSTSKQLCYIILEYSTVNVLSAVSFMPYFIAVPRHTSFYWPLEGFPA
jgi:hypothetical protein